MEVASEPSEKGAAGAPALRSFISSATAWVLILGATGSALVVSGVAVIAGGGWALIASGGFSFLLAAFIVRGLNNG